MAKKEVKASKKEVIEKIIKVVEIFIAPVTAALSVFNLDAGIYVAAGAGMIVSILGFVKLFVK